MNPQWTLPPGSLNIRHRQMRGVWQAFAGRTYIPLASGDSPEDAAEEIRSLYIHAPGTPVRIHSGKNSKTITL